MHYDTETIQLAMARAGRLVQSDMAATLSTFDGSGLSAHERLTALATATAAAAAKRHADDMAGFIATLRELTRPAIGYFGDGETQNLFLSRIVNAAALLGGALDRLGKKLDEAGLAGPTARIVETVALARLLAAHRPQRIRATLAAIETALGRPDYRIGEIIAPAPPTEQPAPSRAASSLDRLLAW